jgi:hypothetical protein
MARPPKVNYRCMGDTDECIDHQQKGGKEGYGHIQGQRLHRIVFNFYNGFLPEVVMHICDNPRCINPKHLVAGTWALNNKDRASKGRSAKTRVDARKLSPEQVHEILSRYTHSRSTKPNPNGISALANEFKVDTNTIYKIVEQKGYKE